MKPAKVNVLVTMFAYGGNGGISMQLPSIGQWWAKTYNEMSADERIGDIAYLPLSDTPITMTRNRALRAAVEGGYDVLLMVDSDNEPDLYVGKDANAKPFWKSSFDFAYERLIRGLPTVIGAPYCGPPPHPTSGGYENVYVFKWVSMESDVPSTGWRIEAYDREQGAQMAGIHPAAALPTGLILITSGICEQLKPPYFRYEYTDEYESSKATTEDVYATRNMSIAGWLAHGEDVVFCNWDAWAGHYKPKCVGKPVLISAGYVTAELSDAVLKNRNTAERLRSLSYGVPRKTTADAVEEERPPLAESEDGYIECAVTVPYGDAITTVYVHPSLATDERRLQLSGVRDICSVAIKQHHSDETNVDVLVLGKIEPDILATAAGLRKFHDGIAVYYPHIELSENNRGMLRKSLGNGTLRPLPDLSVNDRVAITIVCRGDQEDLDVAAKFTKIGGLIVGLDRPEGPYTSAGTCYYDMDVRTFQNCPGVWIARPSMEGVA